MKKLIKKNISVILSVALILGAVLPVFSGVVATAYTAENTVIKNNIDTACDNLIAEWAKLDSHAEGLDKLTPYELFNEASALDLSKFDETSAFVAARQSLANLLVNSFDPTELKTAWGKLYTVDSADFLTPYAVTGEGVADAFYLKSNNSDITITQSSEEEKHIYGSKRITFDYATELDRRSASDSNNAYTLFLGYDPENIADDKLQSSYNAGKKLYNADDLQFSFVVNEINKAATGTKLGFRITGYVNGNDFRARASAYTVEINESMRGKVNTVRLSDLVASISALENWKEIYKTTGSFARIEVQLFDNDAANNPDINITFGSVVGLNFIDAPTAEESANWNVNDWVYAAKSVDTKGLYNTVGFENAISHAEELKEISGVEMSSNIATYNDISSVTLPEENLLKGLNPTINYYDGVSNNKAGRFSIDYKKLADGDVNKTVALEAGDFKNEGAFLELVYDLGATCAIEKTAVVSAYENSLRNYKYIIYAAKTESDLFTKESFALTYINRDCSIAQVFDQTNGPELLAKYIAIRIYIPKENMEDFDDIVRLNELGVYGSVKDYEIIASEFSQSVVEGLGHNLLMDNTTKPYVRADTGNRQQFTSLFDSEVYPITYLYDADYTTGVAVGNNYKMYYDGDTTSLHIYYDLGDTYSIDKFLFSSYSGTNMETGKYRIHASNDLNHLFNGKSVVVDYDNTVDTTRMQIFTMKNAVAARYVSFEVTLALAKYKALIASKDNGFEGTGIRVSELGVYGREYVKENRKENLLSHVPVEVKRVDANGNRTVVGQSDYSGEEHILVSDGDYETFATVTPEGKSVEYTYNLYQNAVIDNIRLVSNAPNISSAKFYVSSSATAVFDESALVYEYASDGETDKKVFEKYFVDTPITASYLRIVATVSSGDLEVAEIEANGYNKNKADYENIALNRTDYVSLLLEDSSNNQVVVNENMDKWIPAWAPASEYQVLSNALDGDLGTIYTYFGGVNNDTSVNMFFNLRAANCVDNVSVYTSLLDDYRPSKMNIYVGGSRDEVFAADATPIKQWTEKILNEEVEIEEEEPEESEGEDIFDGGNSDDDIIVDFVTGGGGSSSGGESSDVEVPEKLVNYGLYSADFTPMEISCVRIEIVEANPTYFAHINKVGGIISEIQINGFATMGNMVDNVLESSKDMVMRALDPVNTNDKSNNNYENDITDGIEGEPVYSVNGIGEDVALDSCNASGGYVEYMPTNTLATSVTLADIDDIYFSYKVKNATRSGSVAARVYIHNGSAWANDFAHKNSTQTVLYVDSANTEWIHTSMSKQFGENWKEWLLEAFSGTSAEEVTINRIRFGWNNKGGAADMLFTGMYYTFNEGANPYYETLSETLGKSGQKAALTMSEYYTYYELFGVRLSRTNEPTPITSSNAATYYSLQGVGGQNFGNSSCIADGGSIRYLGDADVTLAEIDDIYIPYKIDKAISGENVVARIYIYDQDGVWAEDFSAGTARVFYFPTTHTEWTGISVRDVAGKNWKSDLVEAFNTKIGESRTADEIKISEIRFGFNWTGEADMSFGDIYYQYTDEESDAVSVAKAMAIYNNAISKIDVSTVAKRTAKEFKYNVQSLADSLDVESTEAKYISGDHSKTAPEMKELALLAQYLDKTLSADDFMDPYCADVNNDGVIDEADVTALRKQLLGIE